MKLIYTVGLPAGVKKEETLVDKVAKIFKKERAKEAKQKMSTIKIGKYSGDKHPRWNGG